MLLGYKNCDFKCCSNHHAKPSGSPEETAYNNAKSGTTQKDPIGEYKLRSILPMISTLPPPCRLFKAPRPKTPPAHPPPVTYPYSTEH